MSVPWERAVNNARFCRLCIFPYYWFVGNVEFNSPCGLIGTLDDPLLLLLSNAAVIFFCLLRSLQLAC